MEKIGEQETHTGELPPELTIDQRNFDDLSLNEQNQYDGLLEPDAPELFSDQSLPESPSVESIESPQQFFNAEVAALEDETHQAVMELPKEKQEEGKKRAKNMTTALALGGLAFLGVTHEAQAKDFDLGDVLRQELSRTLHDEAQERQQVRQAQLQARRQLQQAQFNYIQKVRRIQAQIAALDNPTLAELTQKQSDIYWNGVHDRAVQEAKSQGKSPEEIKNIKATIDLEREAAEGKRELTIEGKRVNLELQIAKADADFEQRKQEIVSRYALRKAQIEDQTQGKRERRIPRYIPR